MSTITLGDDYPNELSRCRELVEIYKTIPTGGFGQMMIQRVIDAAEKAQAQEDTVAMIRCYQLMKDCQ